MAGELPGARTRAGRLARLRAFVLIGPPGATVGPFEWAKSLAVSNALAQLAWFLVIVAVAAIEMGFGEGDQVKAVLIAGLGALMFAGLQWLLTLLAMLLASLSGWGLVRLPMRWAAVVGALWIGAVALAIERGTAAMYFLMTDLLAMPTWGYWVLTGAIGTLYGGWLPRAFAAYLRDRAERRAASPRATTAGSQEAPPDRPPRAPG